MKLPQQVIPVSRNVITFSASNRMAGVEPSGPKISAHRNGCICRLDPTGKYYYPSVKNCPPGQYSQCYNNGDCRCVNNPPKGDGVAKNQAHVYNAINQIV